MQNAELVLLVHDHEPQSAKGHLLGKQRVRAKEQVHLSGFQGGQEKRARLARHGPGEESDSDSERLEKPRRVLRVLPGQKLGRRQECRLLAACRDQQRGEQRNQGLAASHVSLQQPRHGDGRREIRLDLPHDGCLVTGKGKGEPADERVAHPGAEGALPRPARCKGPLAPEDRDLEIEELFVGERAAISLRRLHARGKMNAAKGFPGTGKRPVPQKRLGKTRLDGGKHGRQRVLDDPAHGGLCETFRERINGKDPAETSGAFAPWLQLEVGALELSPPEPEASPDEEPRARLEHAAKKGPAKAQENRFDGSVGNNRLRRPPGPPADVGRRYNGRHHAHLVHSGGAREGNRGRAILVCAGQKEQKIPHRRDAEPLQALGKTRPHAAQGGDALGQLAKEHGGAPCGSRPRQMGSI